MGKGKGEAGKRLQGLGHFAHLRAVSLGGGPSDSSTQRGRGPYECLDPVCLFCDLHQACKSPRLKLHANCCISERSAAILGSERSSR